MKRWLRVRYQLIILGLSFILTYPFWFLWYITPDNDQPGYGWSATMKCQRAEYNECMKCTNKICLTFKYK